MSTPDTTERWGDRLVVRRFRAEPHVSDPGEEAAFAQVADALDGGAVLDLGVGVGRTSALLASRAARYVGVDVAPAMLDRARAALPDVDLRLGDARDLRQLAEDGAFDVVVFSLNGIDAVDHDDRLRVLAEVHRVLRPGGRCVISTHSLDSPNALGGPSLRHALRRHREGSVPKRAARHLFRLGMYGVSVRNWRRRPADLPTGDGWAMWPLPAHEFRFVCHRVRFAEWLRELRAAGLEPEAAWTLEGAPIPLGAERSTSAYSHVVAHRAG